MGVLPETVIGQIQFCETHLPVWQENPQALGLSAPALAAFATKIEAARKAFDAAQSARAASKAATTALNTDAASMRSSAADLIRTIKAYAESQPSPGTVYAAAQIPEPLPPSPVPAPGVPENLRVTLESTGAVTLSWEAASAAVSNGAFFSVSRKLPGQSAFTQIGLAPGTTSATRTMSFTDSTIPTSAAGTGAQYIIQGQRGTELGPASEAITVQFGVDGAGSFSINGQSTAIKMAA